jgi:hypothetical protein
MGIERLIDLNHNRHVILCKRVSQFVKVAVLLHLASILGLAIFFKFGTLTISALENGNQHFFMYGFFSVSGIVLILFAQMEAYSRFQNYKLTKDLFFENRFKR